jgi:dihydrodipicolinate synthase/N-acetylneuraminate lyase
VKSKNLVGVITPVITTFDPNGEVDRSIAEELVDFLM